MVDWQGKGRNTLPCFYLNNMKTIDKNNWCIQAKQDTKREIVEYFNTNHGRLYLGHDDLYYMLNGGDADFSYYKPNNLQEITFEEFKTYILKQPTMKKEIIGYKAPYDLFGGDIKAGSLLIPDKDTYRIRGHGPLHALPKEIVEQWEPIYKEEERILRVGDCSGVKYEVRVTKKGIFADGKTFSIDDIYSLYSMTGEDSWCGYACFVDRIKIGCSVFTKEEIKQIIDEYERLQ